MKKLLIILMAGICASEATAQATVGNLPGKALDMQANPYGFVTELPPAEKDVKGDVYWNDEWVAADIEIENPRVKLQGHSIRLNLQTNDLELRINNEIRVLAGKRVRSFVITDPAADGRNSFINSNQYKLNGVPTEGFFQVMKESGNWKLLSKPTLKLLKGNYVAALDAGLKEDRWVKKAELFFSNHDTLFQVFTSVPKFANQFGESAGKIKDILKQYKINLRNEEDLPLLLEKLASSDLTF